MKKPFFFTLGLFLANFLLFACSTVQSNDERSAICKELKSKIIFNGNTSNIRKSDIQNSETAFLQAQYEKYHCGDKS